MTDPRRAIPSVDRLLGSAAFAELVGAWPRRRVVDALKTVQAEVRQRVAAGEAAQGLEDEATYASAVAARLEAAERVLLRPVINATGVVLHTNLGRAPLAAAAVAAVVRAASSYSNLEYDLEAGERGSRYAHCVPLLLELSGAEDALVVNNNAGALVLALNTLALGREAVVSRGELIEIGGSFRIPEIMERSGARMRAVGATNRTHPADYAGAIGVATGALLKVHPSNYRVTGFTAEVSLAELAALGAEREVPVINDLGSGLLLDLSVLGLPREPTAAEAIAAGADIVTMSGDKLLGGPQAGILLGRAAAISAMRRNPLCRALRPDKLTLAALEATLALYREPERALREIPTLRMLALGAEALARRARGLADALAANGVASALVAGSSAVGGGAYPEAALPTTLVLLEAAGSSASEVERRLRHGAPPVVARIVDDRVALDARTIAPAEEAALVEAVRDACT